MIKSILCVFLTGMLGMFSCKNSIGSNTSLPSATADYEVSVGTGEEQGIVSPNLMGFNLVYSFEKDAPWQSGKAPGLLKTLGASQLRYPGGTVVTHFHWANPTGQGWSDTWSPTFDAAKNVAPSEFMDVDEYLSLTKKMNIEPLLGINMGSGKNITGFRRG